MLEPEPDSFQWTLRAKPAHYIVGAIEDSGLVAEGDSGVVMVSGGADSVALLAGLVQVVGPDRLVALHVNYGLREEADSDEQLVRRICERLGVEQEVLRAGEPDGNLQAWAREVRLGAAERIRRQREMDWIAIGHNRSDQAETFLYRLASSPGARPLLAMPPRSGYLIRPLLSLDRSLIRRMLELMFPYAEDATNLDRSYARNRIRHQLMPALESVNSGAELNIIRTRKELQEDEEALMDLATGVIADASSDPSPGLDGMALAGQHPAVRRRILRRLAETELDRPVAVTPELAAEVERLAAEAEGGQVDLGGGDHFLAEAGRISVRTGGGTSTDTVPDPVRVDLRSGTSVFGGWEVDSEKTTANRARSGFGDPWSAFLDDEDLLMWLLEASPGPDDLLLTLRPWRFGDRIEPLGMQGSKSLQDVFTDARVPASRRRSWPVLVIGETVIWVPGLVRSRHLRISGRERQVLCLEARPPFPI